MNDGREQGDRGRRRRNPIPWVIGVILVALALFFALRGTFEQIDRDGGSNADGPTPNAGAGPVAQPS
jgi:hypothetical protein